MVLQLAAELEIPLRERNRLLLAAGHAPAYEQRELDDPEMEPVRAALRRLLDAHEPYPALAVDSSWELIDANDALAVLIEGVDPALLAPPANVLRVCLHPDGMAPRILNLGEVRAHLLARLARQAALTGDPAMAALLAELRAYPGAEAAAAPGEIAVPVRVRGAAGDLAFIGTVATFGTAVEITASELSIELFFPADAATARALAERAG